MKIPKHQREEKKVEWMKEGINEKRESKEMKQEPKLGQGFPHLFSSYLFNFDRKT